MKICFAASAGGHLTELQIIFPNEVLGDRETIILTERSSRTECLKERKYFFKHLGYNPFAYLPEIFKCMRVLKWEKVDVVITTGAEIGLVALIAANFLGLKTIFIETITRVKTPTLTGRFSYPFSTLFLTQNPGMDKMYGPKAKYVGGII